MQKHTRGVEVKNGESIDRALKRLKTKLDTEGILEEMLATAEAAAAARNAE